MGEEVTRAGDRQAKIGNQLLLGVYDVKVPQSIKILCWGKKRKEENERHPSILAREKLKTES